MTLARNVFAAVALVGAASSANAATSIVTNGSFEEGPATPNGFTTVAANSPAITGWTVGGDSVDYIGSYWEASAGTHSVDLAGNGPGTLSQLLNTVAGQIYSISFDISKNPDGGLTPRLGTATTGSQMIILSYSGNNSKQNMLWQPVEYFFTAMTAQTLLTFATEAVSATTPGGPSGPAFGLALDNVSVVAAPEPATWAMMLLGFGLVGSALRRRARTRVRFGFA